MKNPYETGDGDCLIVEDNYPDEIKIFLKEEKKFLESKLPFPHLIEVGCMHGRYLDWCAQHNIQYTGVDVVDRYIKMGEKRLKSAPYNTGLFRFVKMDACEVRKISIEPQSIMLFPFNSFGNMLFPADVARSVIDSGCSFVICSYKTDDYSLKIRSDYYKSSGFSDLVVKTNKMGVTFVSPSKGLNSVAFSPSYIHTVFSKLARPVRQTPIGNIGIAYHYSR